MTKTQAQKLYDNRQGTGTKKHAAFDPPNEEMNVCDCLKKEVKGTKREQRGLGSEGMAAAIFLQCSYSFLHCLFMLLLIFKMFYSIPFRLNRASAG